MRSGSIYYASDKALFDALNQHKVTISDLRDLFFTRGIIFSKDTSRKDLAKNFSRLTHDYYDHQKLATILGYASRRERVTSVKVISKLESSDIETAAREIGDAISVLGDTVDVNVRNDKIEVRVNYKETNFNKSEFRQVVQKDAVIVFEKTSDQWSIRNPLNDRIEEIKSAIIDKIEINSDQRLDVEEISLEHINDNEIRTQFFTDLIKNINGHDLIDVSDVYVFHPKLKGSGGDEEEDDDSTDDIHITKASLKGEGVLQSDELKSLYERGFYICKIVWLCKGSAIDSDLYEFEAQFAEPESCTKFSYLAKGFHKYKSPNEFNKSKTILSSSEESKFNKLIEKAAQISLHNLVKVDEIENGELTNDNTEDEVV